MGIFSKSYTADPELLDVGLKVEKSYRDESHNDLVVDKDKIILVIDSFSQLYKCIEASSSDSYYLGNLISTGRIEGARDEVFGTVDDAVKRTKDFIRNSDEIYASQCSFYSRNLKVVLEKESFDRDPRQVLGERVGELEEISTGKIT